MPFWMAFSGWDSSSYMYLKSTFSFLNSVFLNTVLSPYHPFALRCWFCKYHVIGSYPLTPLFCAGMHVPNHTAESLPAKQIHSRYRAMPMFTFASVIIECGSSLLEILASM